MGVEPRTQNEAATIVNTIIQISIMEVGIRAAEAAAIAELPFLGFPVVKQLFGMALRWVGSRIYEHLAHLATFQVIDLQTHAQVREYNEAVEMLRAAAIKGDPNELEAQKVEFRNRLARLIHWDGSASP